ncbi:hypothetical protein OAS49_04120 [Nitrosopumilus sp.]|nr:hypothetical protein [Nitrosopumilus sp.]
MNLKIVSGVCIAFVISFGMLYVAINLLDNSYRIDYKTEFFSDQDIVNENKILLLGSSHIGHLNMSHIITQIENKNLDFTVYNLADNGDSPKFRYNDLEQIINLEPKIVFYGISYRDFDQPIESTNSKTNNLDIRNSVGEIIPEELKSINPQLLTRKVIRNMLDDTGINKKPTYEIKPANTPFFALGDIQTKISDKNELQRQLLIVLPPPAKIQFDSNNEEVEKFYEIINLLQDKEITVVVFTTPLSRAYLDELPKSTKISLDNILKNISEKYDVEIYEFEEKYADLGIWNNVDHIAYNNESIIFSDEIAEMILKETRP